MFFILNLSISMDRSKALLWPWNPFHFQAFAWFSDLLVEHSEIFWSLFGVDMDTVLNEQPPDTYVYFDLYFSQRVHNLISFTDGIPFLCFWFSMIIYERMIIWKMANSTSICEQHLRHKWSDTLTWWKAQSLNLSIKVSKKKDGKSKGKYVFHDNQKGFLKVDVVLGVPTSLVRSLMGYPSHTPRPIEMVDTS